ncbi:hypothetical protein QTA57_10935 [Fontisubflavum oceani]|uniref:hypothetical protein n=1 Tax=Fontisubflavum oceani TaxID=2978973 RepID=UPI0025B51579|nr:hypothetical protein [Fontisubflavum oceani]WJY20381.1 hypothetical protein QTA57_10935 [Fontisubflavum oceani]
MSVFFVSAVCFLAPLSISAQDNPETQAAPEFEVPQDVQSDGSFRYHAAFDIPSYRGLEPNLGLTYTSSFRGLGSAEVWLGVGWQLSGLSQIERVSLGGGTPTHDDARDLYRLDGMELLACSDGEATNPWLTNQIYPTGYRTNATNASCAAGGTFATLVESYRRVEMRQRSYNGQQVDYFIVTETDGTQYRYESLGVLAGDTVGPSDERYAGLFDTTYLLSEIRDTQATPNVVEISYAFAALEEGRAHRPEFIRYGGYEIEFGYHASQTSPLASYATGTRGMLGQQFHLLRSIAIRDGAAPLRAYAFEYQTTETIGRRLLNQVQVYGDDYSLANGIVTGGSQLPNLLSELAYTTEGLDYVEQQATGTPVHEQVAAIMDLDRDGRDEILLNGWYATPHNTPGMSVRDRPRVLIESIPPRPSFSKTLLGF